MEGKVQCTCFKGPFPRSFPIPVLVRVQKRLRKKGRLPDISGLSELSDVGRCVGSRTLSIDSFHTARTRNHHPVLQSAQLASADIIWLIGILQSPCWWTPYAAMRWGVGLLCVFVRVCIFGVLVCVLILHKHPCKRDATLQGTTCKNPFGW